MGGTWRGRPRPKEPRCPKPILVSEFAEDVHPSQTGNRPARKCGVREAGKGAQPTLITPRIRLHAAVIMPYHVHLLFLTVVELFASLWSGKRLR